ncbi:MAG: glycosyltransferase family 4 protein [Lentisphaerae bacterium]|jgi:glycosyltransferase involved in cell wall biosynthesis|nr:glycosyltransferase family 4 protein [Lentisphaerota bacterium]
MHVVQLLPALNEGGVERGVVEINRELVKRGIKNTVISAGGRLAAQIVIDGGHHVTFDVKSKNPLTVPWRVRKLRKLINRLNPDILHVRSRVPAWLVHFANKNPRRPVVSTAHGFNSVSAYSRIMTRADLVICGSGAVIDHIRKAYDTPPSLIRLVHRGIDAETFDPERLNQQFIDEFRQRYDLNGKYVILAVGRITSWKGYAELIEAVAKAATYLPPYRLVIVGGVQEGQEGYAAELREQAKRLGIGDTVVFAGSQTNMAEIYHMADVVVSNCTSKPETFGRTMVEALVMERPVIATAHGGALDIMREGLTGWLLQPGDTARLAEILKEAPGKKFNSLRDYALENFSLGAMVEHNLAIYNEVLELYK